MVTLFDHARKLKKAPISFQAADFNVLGIEYGKILDLEFDDRVVKFNPPPPFFWIPKFKAIGFFVGGKVRPSSVNYEKLAASRNLENIERKFQKLLGRRPQGTVRKYVVPMKIAGRSWYSIGSMQRVGYWSDKFNETTTYDHKHGKGVRLYMYGSPNARATFWIIRGGRLSLTSRGIVH